MERPRFSDMLASRRRQLGLTLQQASRSLRLKEQVLAAFEEGDFEHIPQNGYAQGMLSSYARYLGLDPNAVLDQFNEDLYHYEHGGAPHGTRHARRSAEGQGGSSPLVRMNGQQGSRQHYPQGRPYTGRVPQQGQQRARRASASGSREVRGSESVPYSRIQTRPVEGGYTDDMRYGQTSSPYQAANSAAGRRSSRNIANTQRPNVRRRRGDGQARRGQPSSDYRNMVLGAAVIVVLVLTCIIVFSVRACVNNAVGETGGSSSQTVPVSTTDTSSSGTDSTSGSTQGASQSGSSTESSSTATNKQNSDNESSTSSKANTTTTQQQEPTSVTVSVNADSVSWVEITVDGTSEVAESVTGPWTQTYEPTDTMTIQVGNTSAVTVTKNGQNQSFDSKASGLGTLTIKVPKAASANGSTTGTKDSGGDGGTSGSSQGSASAAASSTGSSTGTKSNTGK